jgi:hypothetical protein
MSTLMRPFTLTGIALVAGLATTAQADVLDIRPDADATIFRDLDSPSTPLSCGSGTGLYAGRTASRGNIIQRSLLRFDLSEIPAGATITDVQLFLSVTKVPPAPAASTLTLHRVQGSWDAGPSASFGGAGTPSEAGDVTWGDRVFPGTAWTTPGGDFVSTPSASTSAPTTLTRLSFASSASLVSDVQGWLDAPATNNGWIMRGNEATGRSTRQFASSQIADNTQRPVLRVTFTPPPACGTIDFNNDSLFPDDGDLIDFLTVLAGGPCGTNTCNSIDFNGDGLFPDDNDLVAFLRVLAGGEC